MSLQWSHTGLMNSTKKFPNYRNSDRCQMPVVRFIHTNEGQPFFVLVFFQLYWHQSFTGHDNACLPDTPEYSSLCYLIYFCFTGTVHFIQHFCKYARVSQKTSFYSYILFTAGSLSEAAHLGIVKIKRLIFTIRIWGGSNPIRSSKIILLTTHTWGLFGQIISYNKLWLGPRIRPTIVSCVAS